MPMVIRNGRHRGRLRASSQKQVSQAFPQYNACYIAIDGRVSVHPLNILRHLDEVGTVEPRYGNDVGSTQLESCAVKGVQRRCSLGG